ncbi:MAG: archaeosine synthase subunit alpha, partial [Haloferacaceae archaeon]
MTEYFEVLERDGAARLGELRLDPPVATPAAIDDRLRDAGSLWNADREVPDAADASLTVLPHRAFPSGTPPDVRQAFAAEPASVDGPTVAVVSSEGTELADAPESTADAPESTAGVSDLDGDGDSPPDAYVLSDVRGFLGHAAGLRDAILAIKGAVPADTALYLSGAATPANVAILAYVGVDLVDRKLARVAGSRGRYLATDGEHFLEDLTELPCSCPACRGPRESFDREDCIEHNVNALDAELRRVRERIREGRLRDYVEGQARHEGWLTATFREFDQEYSYLERRTPVVRDAELTAASEDTLRRVEIQRFADRVTSRYRCRFSAPLALLPCSARKPYSESQSHGQFHDAIGWRAHVVSMTSPIGVVPQELELTYPAQHYDSVVTGRW